MTSSPSPASPDEPRPTPPAARLIRVSAAAAVVAVAGFAAVISYSHIYDLALAHGQSGTAARLLPLSVDGLILAASLVMLDDARSRRRAAPLARCMLGLGVLATIAANVAYGARYGPAGAVISAWPAVAFIGAAEMVMAMVRRAGTGAPAAILSAPAPHPDTDRVFAKAIAAHSVPTLKEIRAELHVGQNRARRVQAYLAALAAA